MLTKKEAYALTKEMLYLKYDGLCSFCGSDLGKIWHIWYSESKLSVINTDGKIVFGNDSYENKLPACISCNSTRIHHCKNGSIEDFRKCLLNELDFLFSNNYFKKMVRYNMIEVVSSKIIFHFEK